MELWDLLSATARFASALIPNCVERIAQVHNLSKKITQKQPRKA
jgi:hypothetical protein